MSLIKIWLDVIDEQSRFSGYDNKISNQQAHTDFVNSIQASVIVVTIVADDDVRFLRVNETIFISPVSFFFIYYFHSFHY